MKLPETIQAAKLDKASWEHIIHSPEWVIYRRFLFEHLIWLQKQSNDCIRNQKFTEAYGFLKAMDDAKDMLDNITIRLQAINKQIEKGEK